MHTEDFFRFSQPDRAAQGRRSVYFHSVNHSTERKTKWGYRNAILSAWTLMLYCTREVSDVPEQASTFIPCTRREACQPCGLHSIKHRFTNTFTNRAHSHHVLELHRVTPMIKSLYLRHTTILLQMLPYFCC